jgi:hypothetical protein
MGEAEERTAKAVEEMVRSNAFGELLARATQNVVGLTKIGFDVLDLTVRNLRLAGKPDIARLGAQLGRTEDKLERVLQEVERLQEEVSAKPSSQASRSNGSSKSRSSNGRSRARSSSNGRSRARSKS